MSACPSGSLGTSDQLVHWLSLSPSFRSKLSTNVVPLDGPCMYETCTLFETIILFNYKVAFNQTVLYLRIVAIKSPL